ncbi:MAG: precorrin-8X methylmutase [Rhodospirillales bacterium]|nr:precorrin-8X methylmutase [Rhodospirillales bacterium]
MPSLFDAYVMVDWSAAAVPVDGADSVWIAASERRDGALVAPRLVNPPTRAAAMAFLADLLSDLIARDQIALVGFDFAFGYPAGFAERLSGPGADWRSVWKDLAFRLRDDEDNANDRFAVAAALNERLSGGPFPFWGCPPSAAGPMLTTTKPAGFCEGLAELRHCDRAAGGPHPVWKLAYPGSVGSQSLLGIARLFALRHHPWLEAVARIWPFETGLRRLERPSAEGWRVLFAEIYPSIFDSSRVEHAIKDARQVLAVITELAGLDDAGRLSALFGGPSSLTQEQRRMIEREEAWILGIETSARAKRVATVAKSAYSYIRDPQEIYRRSFATVRAEIDVSDMPADLEGLAVRLVHAAGDPAIARDLAWSDGAGATGRAALAKGATILVDAQMLAAGIIRARLPANNAVVCMLGEPGLAEDALAIGNTRSAAAVDRWAHRWGGAVITIGNAPTALFRLLEHLDAGAPRPALILGFPVGFIGAAESKDALIAHPAGVPFVALRGRRGGSAYAAAAINALASEAE